MIIGLGEAGADVPWYRSGFRFSGLWFGLGIQVFGLDEQMRDSGIFTVQVALPLDGAPHVVFGQAPVAADQRSDLGVYAASQRVRSRWQRQDGLSSQVRVWKGEQGAFMGLNGEGIVSFTGALMCVSPLLGGPNPSGYVIEENLTAVGFLPEPSPINIVKFLGSAYPFIGLAEGRGFHQVLRQSPQGFVCIEPGNADGLNADITFDVYQAASYHSTRPDLANSTQSPGASIGRYQQRRRQLL